MNDWSYVHILLKSLYKKQYFYINIIIITVLFNNKYHFKNVVFFFLIKLPVSAAIFTLKAAAHN